MNMDDFKFNVPYRVFQKLVPVIAESEYSDLSAMFVFLASEQVVIETPFEDFDPNDANAYHSLDIQQVRGLMAALIHYINAVPKGLAGHE